MRIVFGIDGRGQTSEIGKMLRLAIVSCRSNTSHDVVVIADKFDLDFAAWLDGLEVSHFTVETPLADAVHTANARTGYPLQAIGNYLRYEACRVIDDDMFLYCDCDTIFLTDFAPPQIPKLVAAVAEDSLDDWSRFNTGVLLINRVALLNELDGFYSFASDKLEEFYPGFDQAAFNSYCKGRIERLPPVFNWRPYWGGNSEAIILHTHGVKPSVAEQLFQGIFVADRAKQDLIENLIMRTLTQLPQFSASLIRFQGEETASAWLRLAETAEATLQSPLKGLFLQTAYVRKKMINAWSEAELAALEMAASCGNDIGVVLSPGPDDRTLRVVLSSKSLFVALTDIVNVDGAILDMKICLKDNVNSFNQVEFNGEKYWLIQKHDPDRSIDLVFECNVDGQSFKNGLYSCRVLAIGISRVRYYWSNDAFYTEKNARDAYVAD